jgi:polysaccharide export outer membrane protein
MSLAPTIGILSVVLATAVIGAQAPEPDVSRSQAAAAALAPADGRYRIQPSDVIGIRYVYTPEYDHSATVQPDGYLSAPVVGQLRVAGLTLAEVRDAVVAAVSSRLRDPEVYVDLKEFQKPYVTIAGEVRTPGRLELRGRTTVIEAIALAGGFTPNSKHSQVLLFRPVDTYGAAATLLDVKEMMSPRGVVRGMDVRPGDLLVVPQNRVSKVERYIKWANIGVFINPFNLTYP